MSAGTVEQELWNIFTFYTLNGNPLDPATMRQTQFVKFSRDIGIVGEDATSEALSPLLDADIEVAYTAQVNKKDREGPKRMNYNDFLTTIMNLSKRVYPHSQSIDEAFQRLLMDNVLPHAWRRQVEPIDDVMNDEDVIKLYSYFGDALEQIFQFYGTASVPGGKARKAGTPSKTVTSTLSSVSRSSMGVNSMKAALGYSSFLKLAADFDLSNTVILSTRELGDIFLSAIRLDDRAPAVRKITFDEFWEALVRCAMRAYSKISHSTPLDRVRGLFLYMWRAITRSVPRAFNDRRNVSTYAGDLLSGAMLFNKRFTAMWAEDGYRDYLTPVPVKEESGAAVLARLTQGGTSRSAQLEASTGSVHGDDRAGSAAFGTDASLRHERAAAGAGGSAAHGAQYSSAAAPLSPGTAQAVGVQLDARGYPVPPSSSPDSPAVPKFGGPSGGVGAPPPPSAPRPANAGQAPKTLSTADFYKQ